MCNAYKSYFKRKIEIKEKILHATIIAFSKKGYDKTRMDDIAVEFSVSKDYTLSLC